MLLNSFSKYFQEKYGDKVIGSLVNINSPKRTLVHNRKVIEHQVDNVSM